MSQIVLFLRFGTKSGFSNSVHRQKTLPSYKKDDLRLLMYKQG